MKSRGSNGEVVLSRWILNSEWDLFLFIATPFLIIPVIVVATRQWTFEQIGLFVASFGAVGHHLPGMIRAYGDRALFSRFKTRFIVAPIFLVAVSAGFQLYKLSALQLIVFFWGTWHALMQTYGFLRIYDAKCGHFSSRTRELDLLMCIAWFGAAILWSPTRLPDVLNIFYRSGGLFLTRSAIEGFRMMWTYGTALITIAFIGNLIRSRIHGASPNAIKILLMTVTFTFFWYANVIIANLLLAIALFEVFHDVQYLSIVWVFNRNRVQSGGIGRFAEFIFQPRGALIGLYLGLVLAYGALNFVPRGLPTGTLQAVMTGVLTASTLLHFYYDGFIWKIRESSTSRPLGLKAAKGLSVPSSQTPASSLHIAKWAAFVAPLIVLAVTQVHGTPTQLERLSAVAEAIPLSAATQYELGAAEGQAGHLDQAREHLSTAIRLQPNFPEALNTFGILLGQTGQHQEAIRQFTAAIALRPTYVDAYNNLALLFEQIGRTQDAISTLTHAVALDPHNAEAHNNLGILLGSQNRLKEAAMEFEQAVRIQPNDREAQRNLAVALQRIRSSPVR